MIQKAWQTYKIRSVANQSTGFFCSNYCNSQRLVGCIYPPRALHYANSRLQSKARADGPHPPACCEFHHLAIVLSGEKDSNDIRLGSAIPTTPIGRPGHNDMGIGPRNPDPYSLLVGHFVWSLELLEIYLNLFRFPSIYTTSNKSSCSWTHTSNILMSSRVLIGINLWQPISDPNESCAYDPGTVRYP